MKKTNNASQLPIGATLRKLRCEKGYTQKAIEAQLPYKYQLSKLELGTVSVSIDTLCDILQILNISLDEFIFAANNYQVSYYDYITHTVAQDYASISKEKVYDFCLNLKQFSQNTPSTSAQKIELLRSRLLCFYYINFEHDIVQAQPYAAILFNYLYHEIDIYSIFDVELTTIVFAFCSYDEGHHLFIRAQHTLKKWNIRDSQNLNIRIHLSFAKNMLVHQQFEKLTNLIVDLEALLVNNRHPKYVSELSILKGVSFIELAKQRNLPSITGKTYIKEGLALAKKHQLNNIYTNWSTYCHNYLIDE